MTRTQRLIEHLLALATALCVGSTGLILLVGMAGCALLPLALVWWLTK